MNQQLIPIAITVIGVVLMAFMIYTESEPGLIPLLLVTLGVASYVVVRIRSRMQRESRGT